MRLNASSTPSNIRAWYIHVYTRKNCCRRDEDAINAMRYHLNPGQILQLKHSFYINVKLYTGAGFSDLVKSISVLVNLFLLPRIHVQWPWLSFPMAGSAVHCSVYSSPMCLHVRGAYCTSLRRTSSYDVCLKVENPGNCLVLELL